MGIYSKQETDLMIYSQFEGRSDRLRKKADFQQRQTSSENFLDFGDVLSGDRLNAEETDCSYYDGQQ
jgi:hypothetical protein